MGRRILKFYFSIGCVIMGGLLWTQFREDQRLRDDLRLSRARQAIMQQRLSQLETSQRDVSRSLDTQQAVLDVQVQRVSEMGAGLGGIEECLGSVTHRLTRETEALRAKQDLILSGTLVERQRWMNNQETLQLLSGERERLLAAFARLEERIAAQDDALRSERETVERLDRAARIEPEKISRRLLGPTVQVNFENEVGSGIVLAAHPRAEGGSELYILTAYHVVESAGERPVEVKRYDGTLGQELELLEAEQLAAAPELDLALLHAVTEAQEIDVARVVPRERAGEVPVTSRIVAVGCPLGYAPMHSAGQLTSKWKELEGRTYWMIDAPTIFGNSGGGIFLAESHELIGVLSRVSAYNNLINIAVPHMGIIVPAPVIYEWLDQSGYAADCGLADAAAAQALPGGMRSGPEVVLKK